MSLRKQSTLTPGRVAANRENARKSTGPRTVVGKRRVRLNALKHGRYASASDGAVPAAAGFGLGPEAAVEEERREKAAQEEFARLCEDLLERYDPPDAFAAQQVEDLARLYWKLTRLERGQEAVRQRQVELLELESRERLREMNRDRFERVDPLLQETGLRLAKNYPARFKETVERLQVILELVKRRDSSSGYDYIVDEVYGKVPTDRGGYIRRLYKRLIYARRSAQPLGEDKAKKLQQLLEDEIRAVESEREAFLHEQVEISSAQRAACLAPRGREWTWLIRQENILHRAIDRKVKILMQLRHGQPENPPKRRGRPPKNQAEEKKKIK